MKASIQRLRAEIHHDRRAFVTRVEELATLDLTAATPAILAQAAVALHHGYGALERVARSIEGSLPTGPDWHIALLESMALDIDEIRPRVISQGSLSVLRRLLAFRHFFRHAYAVSLDADRLVALRDDLLEVVALVEADLDAFDEHLLQLGAASI